MAGRDGKSGRYDEDVRRSLVESSVPPQSGSPTNVFCNSSPFQVDFDQDLDLPTETRESVKKASRQLFATFEQVISGRQPKEKSVKFCGSMPVSFCRQHISMVQQGSYLVSEKTDGSRYILLCVEVEEGPTAVLVDRKMAFCSFAGAEIVAKALGVGTILDGEVVFDRTRREFEFLAFDCIADQGRWVAGLFLKERLRTLKEQVLPKLAESQGHLRLTCKSFVPSDNIEQLDAYVKSEGSAKVFKQTLESGQLIHHRTDGYVFHPNTKYQLGRTDTFLKWKYLDLVTIDVCVDRLTQGTVKISCVGPNNGRVDLTGQVAIAPQDLPRVGADMQEHQKDNPTRKTIIEIRFSPAAGVWEYVRLRPDKAQANYIATVLGTIVEIAEALPLQELLYRMLCSPAEDDYHRQLRKMKTQALNYRRQVKASQAPKP